LRVLRSGRCGRARRLRSGASPAYGVLRLVGSHGQLWSNSSGNTIYAKTGADLAFYDSDNDVYVEGGVDVEDDSKDGKLPLVICTSVTFENEPDC